jgi:hypothetical protein
MADYGIKVSRPGYDVTIAGDTDLSFSSGFKTLKEYKVLKLEGDAPNEVSGAHGLSYAPTFIYFREYTDGDGKWMPYTTSYFAPNSEVWVDDTNVYCMASQDIYVVLFIDPLNE